MTGLWCRQEILAKLIRNPGLFASSGASCYVTIATPCCVARHRPGDSDWVAPYMYQYMDCEHDHLQVRKDLGGGVSRRTKW